MELTERQKLNRVGRAILFMWLADIFGGSIFLLVLEALTTGDSASLTTAQFLLLEIPTYIIAPFFMLLPLRALRRESTELVARRGNIEPIRIETILYSLLGVYAATIFIALVAQYVTEAISGIWAGKTLNVSELIAEQAGAHLFIALFSAIAAPVIEEFILRKLLLESLIPLGDTKAIVLSAAIFALFHGNLEQGAYAFIIGIVLADIVLKTGRLWPGMLIHIGINTISTALVWAETGVSEIAAVLIQYVIVAAGMAVIVLSRKKWYQRAKEIFQNNKTEEGQKSILLIIMLAASIGICSLLTFAA